MFDRIIRGGRVVDGTGSAPQTADIAMQDGRIVEVGRVSASAREELDADGLIVTPGFVDIHTHYDGQATWDSHLAPSCYHGVTTLVMGNCGVGFAPVRPGQEEFLIQLMEGVEDIPGTALHEGGHVRHTAMPIVLVTLALSAFSACGSNQESPSTPFSNQEFDLTGSQRQQQNTQQYQQKSDQEFDAAQAQAEKAAEETKKAPPANAQ